MYEATIWAVQMVVVLGIAGMGFTLGAVVAYHAGRLVEKAQDWIQS